jgi:hypothetical protein
LAFTAPKHRLAPIYGQDRADARPSLGKPNSLELGTNLGRFPLKLARTGTDEYLEHVLGQKVEAFGDMLKGGQAVAKLLEAANEK